MGTGLFFALLPYDLRGACRLTGVEYDPVTARIARLCIRRRGSGARIIPAAISPAASI